MKKLWATLIALVSSKSVLAAGAMIAATSTSGGFVNLSGTAATGLNARIGQWGTPYPYGENGQPLPGAEPSGKSSLYITIDVGDGGLLEFDYALSTYDAGIYDWADIYLQTPTGIVSIANKLGKPGSDYGTFFQMAPQTFSAPLDAWRNSRVTLVLEVQQDGWGDETMLSVSGLRIASCPVSALTPMDELIATYGDPYGKAADFEAGSVIDEEHLTSNMQSRLGNFRLLTRVRGGVFTLNSAYRPPAYQAHLREIYSKWKPPGNLETNNDPRCAELRSAVGQEFSKHGLGASRVLPASPNGSHTQGLAIDARTTVVDVDSTADDAGLYRNLRTTDPVHFIQK